MKSKYEIRKHREELRRRALGRALRLAPVLPYPVYPSLWDRWYGKTGRWRGAVLDIATGEHLAWVYARSQAELYRRKTAIARALWALRRHR